MIWLTSTIFVVTYLLIAARRLRVLPVGRPAGALLGAVAMVAGGALSPTDAYAAIDANTLVLLFATMALSTHLERAGVFAALTERALKSRLSPSALLTALVFFSGTLSAFLLNDTVCIFLTPVVCEVCVRRKLPLAPYLLGLATSSNIGSGATLVGNPQNILIGSLGPLSFAGFAARVAPAALVGLGVNALLLRLFFAHVLNVPSAVEALPKRESGKTTFGWAPVLVTLLVAVGYVSGLHLALTTLVGVCVLVVLAREEPRHMLAGIDWTLLVMFAALFVVTAGFVRTGLPARAFAVVAPHLQLHSAAGVSWFSGSALVGSNLVSNVPLVMLAAPLLRTMADPERGFALLGWVSTVAGNMTLLGSVANLIVAEGARGHHELGFFEYLRFGAISTAVVLLVTIPLVCLLS